MSAPTENKPHGLAGLFTLSLGAIGVVYGDIGTSPLYAIKEIFFGRETLALEPQNVIGAISLVIWAITIMVSFKYVVYVLRADNDGEGGVFALYGLLHKKKAWGVAAMCGLLILAAGLLFGDGVITPAISVISAVEGLTLITEKLTPFIVPITLAILTGLFLIQQKGTTAIGKIFGPIIVLWFVAIAVLGIYHLQQNPAILQAFNPIEGVFFLAHQSFYRILLILGSVILVVTGGEAMYADMGHFGRLPIRVSWFTVAFPALILNYLGQGAFLLLHPQFSGVSIFFSMVPHWALIPMIILATLATIIASQALITGAFSLTAQAISLNLIPFLRIVHTHDEHEGQLYVPLVNWLLLAGCWFLVLWFQSSSRLASAYGLAVAAVMVITSFAMFYVAKLFWHWKDWQTWLLFVPLTAICIAFLAAASLKLFEGGYVPLTIGLVILLIMTTWRWGQKRIVKTFSALGTMKMRELLQLKDREKTFLPRSIIFLTPSSLKSVEDEVPLAKQLFLERYGMLPKHLIFLHLHTQRVPRIHRKDRYELVTFYDHHDRGSIAAVEVSFGFMEKPNLREILKDMALNNEIHLKNDPKEWLIHELREITIRNKERNILYQVRFWLFQTLLRNSNTFHQYIGLGNQAQLSLEIVPVKF